ncbi:MAG: hypothetical protein AAGD35_21415 [Actinomycetota bacterium]
MSDLDIQIDVPDDDDLGSSVRVVGGDAIPPWLKAAAILILGGLAAIMAVAFLVGRNQGSPDPTTTTVEPSGPAATTAGASPALERSEVAVRAWETFARSGDLDAVSGVFDPAGPQYAMFSDAVADPRPERVDFAAVNMSEEVVDGLTTVSLDLVVDGPGGRNVYPYDFVYLDGSEQVWTVTDRRAPGSAALPPSEEVVADIAQAWTRFTSSMSSGDGPGAFDVVGEDSKRLADQVSMAAAGEEVDEPLLPVELFELLVGRARASSTTGPEETLVALLDPDQRQTLLLGELTLWTMVDDDRVVASLEVAGEPMAVVPFVAADGVWAFDLKGALESSGGTP